jgi:hypothetical protein
LGVSVTDEDFGVRLGQVERAIAVINTIENNPDLRAAIYAIRAPSS